MNIKEGTNFDAIKNETEYFSYIYVDGFTWFKEGIAVVVNDDIRISLYYKIWGK